MRLPTPILLALLVAGCLGGEPAPETPRGDAETSDASLRPITERFTGSATGTPVAPFSKDFPFEVPRGAVGVNGTLAWEKPAVDAPFGLADTFDLALLDPDGEVVSEGYSDVEGHLVVATLDPPKAGTWTFRVSSQAAANTPFTLDVVAELIVPENNTITKTLELRAFYEVNLILEEGASFSFSFNASAPVRWDIHSHPPEGLKEWETGEGTTGSASFTAPSRDVFSVLWENPGPLPAQLSFEVVGRFRTHSHSG